MKNFKYIFIAMLLIFSSLALQAQIDRSNPPKPTAPKAIDFGKTTEFKLKNGLTVIVVENHKLPRVNFNLFMDNNPYFEGDKAGFLSMLGSMMRAGTKNYTKEKLDEEIDFLGSDFWTYSGGVGFSTLTSKLEPTIDLATEVFFNPTFNNQEELDKLKTQSKSGLESGKKNPDAIMSRVSNVLLYGVNTAYGEYETEESIDNITLQDFKDYYNTHFKPDNAYLTIVGDITPKEAKKIVKTYFKKWKASGVEKPAFSLKPAGNEGMIAVVDLPTATQSSISITNTNSFKKTSTDYIPAKLGNSVLGGGSFGRLFKNIREDKGWTYGAYSGLDDDRYLGEFSAGAKVRTEVTDSAIVEFLKEIKKIKMEAIPKEELDIKKAEFTGSFARQLEDPSTVAQYARNEKVYGLPKGFYQNYAKSLNNVTGAQINQALSNYIADKPLILIVGNANEFKDQLKQFNIPIKYFDIYGNPTEAPSGIQKTDKTVKEVLDQYITFLGGKEKAEAVKTIYAEYDANSAQVPIPMKATEKRMVPNKQFFILEGNGMQLMGDVFNGKTGYRVQQGMKMPLEENEIAEKQEKIVVFPQLNAKIENYTVEGISTEDGMKVYKLVYMEGEKNTEEYYDVNTGALVKTVDNIASEQGVVKITYTMKDYKEVNGVKFPHQVALDFAGQFGLNLTATSIEVNKKLTDADFE